jgi:hypothetical protein
MRQGVHVCREPGAPAAVGPTIVLAIGGVMAYAYDELKGMTIAELRDIAQGVQPPLQGYTQMNKEHLLPALCKALNIDTHHHHHHHHAAHRHHPTETFDKAATKATLRMLKAERERALEAHDSRALHLVRRRMHALRRRIRVMAD